MATVEERIAQIEEVLEDKGKLVAELKSRIARDQELLRILIGLDPKRPEQSEKPRKPRACSACGETGHWKGSPKCSKANAIIVPKAEP